MVLPSSTSTTPSSSPSSVEPLKAAIVRGLRRDGSPNSGRKKAMYCYSFSVIEIAIVAVCGAGGDSVMGGDSVIVVVVDIVVVMAV